MFATLGVLHRHKGASKQQSERREGDWSHQLSPKGESPGAVAEWGGRGCKKQEEGEDMCERGSVKEHA